MTPARSSTRAVTAGAAAVPSSHRMAWVAWSAVCVIWGTTYLAIKIALATVPPFLMSGMRYTSAGLILAVMLRLRGGRLPPPSEWGRMAFLGFFMLFLGNGGVVWGEQFVPSGLTAVLIGTSPFWMVSIDALFPNGARLHGRQWLGLGIGFAGIVLLVWPDIVAATGLNWGFAAGVISLQVACAGWSIGSAYTRRRVASSDVFGSAALQMLFGGSFMLLGGLLMGEGSRLSFTATTAGALVYLSLAGSVVAFAAFSYALQHLEVAVVSLYTYVNPIIAVALGTVVLGEPFELRMLAAAAIIVVGMFVVGPVTKK